MPDNYFLSETDVRTLREMVAAWRNNHIRQTGVQRVQPHVAADAYIARTGDDGIPGLITGQASIFGTGTDQSAYGPDIPGSALCDIYRIVESGNTSVLNAVEGLDQTVYNLSENDLPANSWIAVVKDKFGSWIALRSGDESSGSSDALWCNCQISGSAITTLANVDIPTCIQIASDTYLFLFSRSFRDESAFTVCGIVANNDFFYEDYTRRTNSSCVMKTASGGPPTGHFGITVHGVVLDEGEEVFIPPIAGTSSGTGTGCGACPDQFCLLFNGGSYDPNFPYVDFPIEPNAYGVVSLVLAYDGVCTWTWSQGSYSIEFTKRVADAGLTIFRDGNAIAEYGFHPAQGSWECTDSLGLIRMWGDDAPYVATLHPSECVEFCDPCAQGLTSVTICIALENSQSQACDQLDGKIVLARSSPSVLPSSAGQNWACGFWTSKTAFDGGDQLDVMYWNFQCRDSLNTGYEGYSETSYPKWQLTIAVSQLDTAPLHGLVLYEAQSWDQTSPLVMTKVYDNQIRCSGFPETIIVYPGDADCSNNTGTGQGESGFYYCVSGLAVEITAGDNVPALSCTFDLQAVGFHIAGDGTYETATIKNVTGWFTKIQACEGTLGAVIVIEQLGRFGGNAFDPELPLTVTLMVETSDDVWVEYASCSVDSQNPITGIYEDYHQGRLSSSSVNVTVYHNETLCHLLTEEDVDASPSNITDPRFVIESGPYTTSAGCSAVCGVAGTSTSTSTSTSTGTSADDPVTTDCCVDTSATLYVNITSGSLNCAITNQTMTYSASGTYGPGWYTAFIACGGNTFRFIWQCEDLGAGPIWTLRGECDGTLVGSPFGALPDDCTFPYTDTSATDFGDCGAADGYTWTVSDAPL